MNHRSSAHPGVLPPTVGALAWLHLLPAVFSLLATLEAAEFHVTTNTVVATADVNASRKALRTEDDFVRALSDFDRASRVKSEQPVSREQFLNFIEGEAIPWSEQDVARMAKAASGAREKLSKFTLALPERVLLVQTTGKEEANAAYCRGTNVIVMSRHFVNAPSSALESVLIHELFHLLSRNHPELRTKLYALIGFSPCGEIPSPVELDSRRITNPDAPRLDFKIDVTRQERNLAVVPVLFATPERWTREKGGEFFHYLTWKLMAVEFVNQKWRAARLGDKTVLLDARDVTNFRQQIGEDPGPVLQPEEILAEYFVKWVNGGGKVPEQVLNGLNRLFAR